MGELLKEESGEVRVIAASPKPYPDLTASVIGLGPRLGRLLLFRSVQHLDAASLVNPNPPIPFPRTYSHHPTSFRHSCVCAYPAFDGQQSLQTPGWRRAVGSHP